MVNARFLNWLASVVGFALLPLILQLFIQARTPRGNFANEVFAEIILVALVVATAAIYEIQTSLADDGAQKGLYQTLSIQVAVIAVGAYVVFKSTVDPNVGNDYWIVLLAVVLSTVALAAIPIELVRRSKV